MRRSTRTPVEVRFWRHVVKGDPDACWEWQGYLSGGYGKIHLSKTEDGRSLIDWAHRVSYRLAGGETPPGAHLDHLCRNPRCVNPAHLELVTPRENVMRGTGWAARRGLATECPNGHTYTPETSWTNAEGHRRCRPCDQARRARSRQKARAAS